MKRGPRWAGVVDRLREPSTWAGIAALAILSRHPLPEGLTDAAPALVALLSAVLAAVLDERGPPPPPPAV